MIESRFSLNLAAQTLEQVLSRRRKMLMDMAYGIELDLREALTDRPAQCELAIKILRSGLEYAAYQHTPEWFNNDDNFAAIMQNTLYLQRLLVNEIKKLEAAMAKDELNLKGWKNRSSARIMLVCGWVLAKHTENKNAEMIIDLREVELRSEEGKQLAQLLKYQPKLTSLDVRGNETLGEEGVRAIEDFMRTQKVTNSTSVAHSLCGITPAKSRLEVFPDMGEIEVRIVCAELENAVWAEGVSAAMGAKSKGSSHLNRRGGSHQGGDTWQPLIWAAKENQQKVALKLIEHGHDVNKQEAATDKSLAGYAPLHWAAQKGHKEMLLLLLEAGADTKARDKHGNEPKALATKKGFTEIVNTLEDAAKNQAKGSGAHGAHGREHGKEEHKSFFGAGPGHRGRAAINAVSSATNLTNLRNTVTPREGPSDGQGTLVVARQDLVLRRSSKLDSEVITDAGKVTKDTVLLVLQTATLAEGTVRAQVAFEKAPAAAVGWITFVKQDGTANTRPKDEAG